jgi:hypothetical protein
MNEESWLPTGYSWPSPEELVTAEAMPGYGEYGGATRSTAVDGNSIRYRACCANGPVGAYPLRPVKFGFSIFAELPDHSWREVAYWTANGSVPFCTGRGSINPQGDWIAVINENGNDTFGKIPGWVPRADNYVIAAGSVERLAHGALDGVNAVTLDLARFGANVVAYNIRLTLVDPIVGVRLRLDDGGDLGNALTSVVLEAGQRNYTFGIVNASPDKKMYVIADNGAVQEYWVDLLGYFTSA